MAGELGLPLLSPSHEERARGQNALTVERQAELERAFNELLGGLFDLLRSVPGLVFAGGAVLGALIDASAHGQFLI